MKITRRISLILILVIGMTCFQGLALSSDVGPENGFLVIVGGAMKDPVILERFMQLAGGPEAPIVVIPTAGAARRSSPQCNKLRATVHYLPIRDRACAVG